MLAIASGADNPVRMTGHNAHDVIVEADDGENWPDLDLVMIDAESEHDSPHLPPDDDAPEAA